MDSKKLWKIFYTCILLFKEKKVWAVFLFSRIELEAGVISYFESIFKSNFYWKPIFLNTSYKRWRKGQIAWPFHFHAIIKNCQFCLRRVQSKMEVEVSTKNLKKLILWRFQMLIKNYVTKEFDTCHFLNKFWWWHFPSEKPRNVLSKHLENRRA